MKTIAVIDIGKTNAKVAFGRSRPVRGNGGAQDRKTASSPKASTRISTLSVCTASSRRASLRCMKRRRSMRSRSPLMGATAVLLDKNGDLALPLLDYEFTGPDTLAEAYEKVRPPFAETGAARLPMGLNIGAQIYWQEQTYPERFAAVASILTYAQYWSYRLTGVLSTELTSLGCPYRSMEPLYRRFFYHGRCPWLASAVCAGAPRQRYSRRLDAAGRTGCQPAGGAAGLLRYPRFQLLALAACADAGRHPSRSCPPAPGW